MLYLYCIIMLCTMTRSVCEGSALSIERCERSPRRSVSTTPCDSPHIYALRVQCVIHERRVVITRGY